MTYITELLGIAVCWTKDIPPIIFALDPGSERRDAT